MGGQTPEKVVTTYQTAVFRIHNPSHRKRAMLDDALTRNHRAYSKVLTQLLPQVESYAGLRGLKRTSAIQKAAATLAKPLPLAIGAKAGLANDVAGQLASHIELREKKKEQETVSPPSAAPLSADPSGWDAALDRLAASLTLEEEGAARDDLARQRRAGWRRPVLFLKNRPADGFLVLCHPEKDDYYAWLNLHPQDSRFARKVQVDGLVDIRTGEPQKFSSKTGALFPLAFGRQHQMDRFIRVGRPQSAKLLERDGAFELHVTFEFRHEEVATARVLGVDRGIYNLASLVVVDDQGRALAARNVDGMELRHVQRIHERRQRAAQQRGRHYTSGVRRAMADEAVHRAANAVVDMAREHRTRVVLEELGLARSGSGGPRRRNNFNRLLGHSQYQKLQRVVEYKLRANGFPRPVTVAAAYTSQTCPECGLRDRENRQKLPEGDGFRMDRFRCVRCGFEADADLNAARVIALKRLWREGLPDGKRKKLEKELDAADQFDEFLKNCARERGNSPPGGRKAGTSEGGGLDVAGPIPPPETAADSHALARTSRRKKTPAAKPPQGSSSSEIPPLPEGESPGKSGGPDKFR